MIGKDRLHTLRINGGRSNDQGIDSGKIQKTGDYNEFAKHLDVL